jgi:thiamine-phosphate pyrophosphorylase
MSFSLPRLYPVTDTKISGLAHAEQTARLIAGGAGIVQIREKYLNPREFLAAAKDAVAVASQHRIPLIVNDRADIALLVGAAGVHLGQDDLPPAAARELLGSDAIIGFSTHNLEQAKRAAELPINYLALGPIFATSSKENPDPMVGLAGLREVRRAVPNLPLVAIGGITLATAREVIEAGADSIAVIGALLAEPDQIEQRTHELLAQLDD